jgi:hypothetical protein
VELARVAESPERLHGGIAWSDIADERWYLPNFRVLGRSQWNSVNWLAGHQAEYPANTTRLEISGLPDVTGVPVEQHEFVVVARNYSSAMWSNVAGVGFVRSATVNITPTPGFASPFCALQPPVADVSAFFDQDGDGLVAGFPNAATNVTFPADVIVNVSSNLGYDVVPGSRFAQNQATQANLVVVARFYSCLHGLPQFVAAHFAVYGDPGRLVFEPVLMLAGDEFNDPPTGVEAVKGVVLIGAFDGQMDQAAFDTNVARGSATGTLAQGTLQIAYGATLQFAFEVPIEAR